VFHRTVEFLQSHAVEKETLVQADGSPLTIGRVHQEIARLLSEQGMDVPEGIIFAIGRDAGVPHNKGNDQDVIQLGKSIIFDMGTREANGGYYYDMTRSFCLGYAPAVVQRAYDDVKGCIEKIINAYEVGASVRKYQRMAFDFFESRGHPTIGSDTTATSGFVHGLGHGIGLAVHEEPFFTDQPSNLNIIQPGHIFTCEPGLYYPEKGFGVRIEDVIYIDPSCKVHDLTDYPKELVVKM
jgi:Xaa-Pro aminopeptidase